YSLSASLPEETGLGERFWYWRGASGQSYIHSIYSPGLCPPVAGAIYVLVRKVEGVRQAFLVGLFGGDGLLPSAQIRGDADFEIHVHLLARDAEAADKVLRDLQAALVSSVQSAPERRAYQKPCQLELLAA
ncbi:MAG: hypothetical protein NTY98_03225, partial [Verrucomicrobia bacterium]|nr:hypothetical protein [Verrucomicrobiota bacterium]